MTQNKIAPMTTIIKMPIIKESTTISCLGGWDTPQSKAFHERKQTRFATMIYSEQLSFHHDAYGEDYISNDCHPKTIERDKRNQCEMPDQGECSKH
jgi:hypothetical protein